MIRSDLSFSDYNNIKANLPKFIRYVYEDKRFPRFSWAEFAEEWAGRTGTIQVQYEDLRRETGKELQRILTSLAKRDFSLARCDNIADKFSFEKMSGRQAGEEDSSSFLRKEGSGDWKNHFTRESAELFNLYAGETLISLGYEQDSSWLLKV